MKKETASPPDPALIAAARDAYAARLGELFNQLREYAGSKELMGSASGERLQRLADRGAGANTLGTLTRVFTSLQGMSERPHPFIENNLARRLGETAREGFRILEWLDNHCP